MKKTLKFEVEVDENNLPESINMLGEETNNSAIALKALMVAAWDATRKETLRVDIWTMTSGGNTTREIIPKGFCEMINFSDILTHIEKLKTKN